MYLVSRPRRRAYMALILAASFLLAFSSILTAYANVPLTQIGSDPYTNSTSQHATMVEPDTFSFGSTIVSAQQSGRFFDGGASNVCWSTSTNNGSTWTSGCLPGITKHQNPANPYDRATDPSVAYDAQDNVWMISTLALLEAGGVHGAAVLTSRSTDGGFTWGNPVTTATGGDLDKNWIVCDNTASSPFYGNCYTQWDDHGNGNLMQMSTSTNGGLTWGAAKSPSGHPSGLGGQPVVQPNGTVIVPYFNGAQIGAFKSTNGGGKWGLAYLVANVSEHTVAGNLRTSPLPSAEVASDGKVFVVWQDCRFRSGCTSNDIVMSSSTNGQSWTAAVRIPIDTVTSGVDHFIPGIAVDKSTSGSSTHIGVTYYFYPNTSCTLATCQLSVGFISSTNAGSTWSAATQLAGPMTMTWLPNTSQGRMVGDYISTSYGSDGLAHAAFAVASAPDGGSDCATATPTCNQPMFTTASGQALGAPVNPAAPAVVQSPVAMSAAEHASANSALATR